MNGLFFGSIILIWKVIFILVYEIKKWEIIKIIGDVNVVVIM